MPLKPMRCGVLEAHWLRGNHENSLRDIRASRSGSADSERSLGDSDRITAGLLLGPELLLRGGAQHVPQKQRRGDGAEAAGDRAQRRRDG